MINIVFICLCGFCAGQAFERESWSVCVLNVIAVVLNGMILVGKLGLIK